MERPRQCPRQCPFGNLRRTSNTVDVRNQAGAVLIAGVAYLRAVSVPHETTGAPQNVPVSLHTVRVVSPEPGRDNFTSLERARSESSFDSMHSVDHGSLGMEDSQLLPPPALPAQQGQWTIYTRPSDQAGCFESQYEPATHPFPKPSPEIRAESYHGADVEVQSQAVSCRSSHSTHLGVI
jgi:hypothetical protein